MRHIAAAAAFAVAGCNGGNTNVAIPPSGPTPVALPTASSAIPVPAGVVAISGYKVTVFATPPSGSTKPDSVVQMGNSVFVGFGDDVNPDGTAGPSGKTSTEVVQYDLTGKVIKTYSVIGHNDGLMAFNANTLWAMSNEDANPTLVVINTSTGSQQTYLPQPGLVNSSGALPNGGGLDDMQIVNGTVYVSASNPATNAAVPCPANSSTPGCPNGVSTVPFLYALTLNSGSTFNLTPIASSNTPVTNSATGATMLLNMTDPDSEAVTLDGTTLVVDSQADGELVFLKNPGAGQTITYVPLTLGGASQQVDDTRFVPTKQTFAVLADTPANLVYRIDGAFNTGDAYSAGQTAFLKLNMASGAFTPIVTGMQAPHGIVFVH